MSALVVRDAEPHDLATVATLIEEVERHYGATVIQPFDERLQQVENALFSTPPLAYGLLVEGGGVVVGFAAYSFLWRLPAPPTPCSSRNSSSGPVHDDSAPEPHS